MLVIGLIIACVVALLAIVALVAVIVFFGTEGKKKGAIDKKEGDNPNLDDKSEIPFNGSKVMSENMVMHLNKQFNDISDMMDKKLKAFAETQSAPVAVPARGIESLQKEIKDLKDKNNELDKSIIKLKSDLDNERNNVKILREEKAKQEERINKLKEEHARGHEDAQKPAPIDTKVLDTIKNALIQIETDLDGDRDEIGRLAGEINGAVKAISALEEKTAENSKGMKAVYALLKKTPDRAQNVGAPVEKEKNTVDDGADKAELEDVKKQLKEAKEWLEKYDELYAAYDTLCSEVNDVVNTMLKAKDATSPDYLREVLNECMLTLDEKIREKG